MKRYVAFLRGVTPMNARMAKVRRAFEKAGCKNVAALEKLIDKLPLKRSGARILASNGREVFTAYVPMPRIAVFMALIQDTYGRNITTRSWDTVRRCAKAP